MTKDFVERPWNSHKRHTDLHIPPISPGDSRFVLHTSKAPPIDNYKRVGRSKDLLVFILRKLAGLVHKICLKHHILCYICDVWRNPIWSSLLTNMWEIRHHHGLGFHKFNMVACSSFNKACHITIIVGLEGVRAIKRELPSLLLNQRWVIIKLFVRCKFFNLGGSSCFGQKCDKWWGNILLAGEVGSLMRMLLGVHYHNFSRTIGEETGGKRHQQEVRPIRAKFFPSKAKALLNNRLFVGRLPNFKYTYTIYNLQWWTLFRPIFSGSLMAV